MSMKTILNISVLTFLLVAASSPCFAEMLITDVSRAKAKEMGVAIRSHKNGDAGVKVRLEFRTQGVLKDFNRVELIICANSQLGAKRLVSAPLLAERPAADSVSACFSADPSYLATSEVWIIVNDPPLGGTGYRFKVIDFIEPEVTAGSDRQPEDKAHSDWLARIVKQTETIKVGMTRREVENVLVEDVGGFVNPKTMRYQHPACSCIKLDLEFELAVSGDRKDDKIVKRSMPLLDLVPNKARW